MELKDIMVEFTKELPEKGKSLLILSHCSNCGFHAVIGKLLDEGLIIQEDGKLRKLLEYEDAQNDHGLYWTYTKRALHLHDIYRRAELNLEL